MSFYVDEEVIEAKKITPLIFLRILFFGENVTRPKVVETPRDFQLDFTEHIIKQDEDINLSAWYIPNKLNNKIVVMFHGYANSKSSLLPEAKEFYDRGYSIFLTDFRGGGDSSLSSASAGYYEAEDVVNIDKYINETFEYKEKIYFGHSMGATSMFRAIAVYNLKPDKVIVEAMYYSLLRTVQSRVKLLGIPSFPLANLIVFWGSVQQKISGFKMDISTFAGDINCPTLMLHGEIDPKAELKHAMELFHHIKAMDKKFVIMPGLVHEAYFVNLKDQWCEEVFDFLEKDINEK